MNLHQPNTFFDDDLQQICTFLSDELPDSPSRQDILHVMRDYNLYVDPQEIHPYLARFPKLQALEPDVFLYSSDLAEVCVIQGQRKPVTEGLALLDEGKLRKVYDSASGSYFEREFASLTEMTTLQQSLASRIRQHMATVDRLEMSHQNSFQERSLLQRLKSRKRTVDGTVRYLKLNTAAQNIKHPDGASVERAFGVMEDLQEENSTIRALYRACRRVYERTHDAAQVLNLASSHWAVKHQMELKGIWVGVLVVMVVTGCTPFH